MLQVEHLELGVICGSLLPDEEPPMPNAAAPTPTTTIDIALHST